MLIVGTTTHLEDLDREYTLAIDVCVTGLASSRKGTGGSGLPSTVWALLDGERIDRVDELDLAQIAALPDSTAQSVAALDDGSFVVGFAGARLAIVSPGGALSWLGSFDSVPGRERWENPAGTTPDLRSIAVSSTGRCLANVHVGGIWCSDDHGVSWRNVVPPDADVHEVVTGDDGLVAAAAADGLGWSSDGGETWKWTTDGLHAPYARAVALDGDVVFVSASTGPATSDGRLYRARLGETLTQCTSGLPPSFPFNIDTGTVTASQGGVAIGTHNGRVYRSGDGGSSWELAVEGMRPVRALRFV